MRLKSAVKPIACWVLVAVWMGFIFYMSAQNAADSSSQSAGLIRGLLTALFGNVSDATVEGLQHTVRKLAHFTEYSVLGALLSLAVGCHTAQSLHCFLASLGIGTVYAVTDEVHQLFVDGRACQIQDMLIDSVGVAVGSAAVMLIIIISKKFGNNKP